MGIFPVYVNATKAYKTAVTHKNTKGFIFEYAHIALGAKAIMAALCASSTETENAVIHHRTSLTLHFVLQAALSSEAFALLEIWFMLHCLHSSPFLHLLWCVYYSLLSADPMRFCWVY